MDSENLNLAKLGLSSPWMIYYKQLEAFFKKDPEIEMSFNNVDCVITIRVQSTGKAEALEKLLPAEKVFGNVTVRTKIIPGNAGDDKLSLLSRVLDGNPIVEEIVTTDIFGMKASYVVFNREVVQYRNDDLSDLHGLCSTLYQDLAKEIFGEEAGVFYCTDVNDPCCCCGKN